MLAHSSERVNSDSEGDASKVERQTREHSVSCLHPQKPKEIFSANRKTSSEQSPIRCGGTSSRHSVESVSNQNFTRDGEEFTKVPRAVAEAKSYSCEQLLEFGKYCEELSWNHRKQLHFLHQRQAELQKELYVEQKKRHQLYYCNLDRTISGGRILWNAVAVFEMTKTSWQTGNLKMNEDLGDPSGTCFVRGWNLGRRCSDC